MTPLGTSIGSERRSDALERGVTDATEAFFIKDYVAGSFDITELAERYGVSRKTAYKWITRFEEEGYAGLADRSRRPCTSPTRVNEEIADQILQMRKRHPRWGAKKLLHVLHQRHPNVDWPARSTVCDLLKRNGTVKGQRRRSFPGHPGPPTSAMTDPNAV